MLESFFDGSFIFLLLLKYLFAPSNSLLKVDLKEFTKLLLVVISGRFIFTKLVCWFTGFSSAKEISGRNIKADINKYLYK